MHGIYRIAVPSLLLMFFFSSLNAAEAKKPFLHPLFANDMVLQREVADPIWGWTQPGQQVTVSLNGKTATAVGGADGKWMTKIGPFPAGGPYELTVSGVEQVKLSNVLIGDVWICSGQSNMEMGVGNALNGQQEIAQADHPMLRLFTVAKHPSSSPEELFVDKGEENKWLICTPKNVAVGDWSGFSAVGYFFGRDLQEHLKIPIGLIHTSWGGTVAEAWTSGSALKQMPDFRQAVEQVESIAAGKTVASLQERTEQWYAKSDPGSAGGLGWAEPALDDADWKSMKLPTYWEDAGVGMESFDGVVWFRRVMEAPADWVGHELSIHLGTIDDRDTTWVNGVRIGSHDAHTDQRDYKVPASAVKDRKLVVAVRVLDTGGKGGIYGNPDAMKIDVPANLSGSPLSLAGDWKYKVGVSLVQAGTPPQPMDAGNPNIPTVLYNGMVNPLVPFGFKGAIWYQGESNGDRATQYRTLLPTMITDWRNRFGVGDFPFLIVQLAAFLPETPEPQDAPWSALREAQALTADRVGHSAIAVATDIGDASDIHPKNKQEVGRRLALDAEAIAYGENVEYAGPTFKDMETKGNQLLLHFTHLGGGLEARGGEPLKGFSIAGADKNFVWADAKIDGDTVVLSSTTVANPVAARYAWQNNPAKANLYNKAGLPAPPFRTDVPK